MKRSIQTCLLLIACILLSACGVYMEDVAPVPTASAMPTLVQPQTPLPEETPQELPEEEPQNIPYTYAIEASIHKDLPPFTFRLLGVYAGGNMDRVSNQLLLVLDEKRNTIFSEELEYDEWYDTRYDAIFHSGNYGLRVTDLNFDGYKDIMLLYANANAYGNHLYYAWLWDSEKGEFSYSDSFAEILNPAIDRKKKCYYSTTPDGVMAAEHRIYAYVGDAFVCTQYIWEEEYEDEQGEYLELQEYRLVDGELQPYATVREYREGKKNKQVAAYYTKGGLWELYSKKWYMSDYGMGLGFDSAYGEFVFDEG